MSDGHEGPAADEVAAAVARFAEREAALLRRIGELQAECVLLAAGGVVEVELLRLARNGAAGS